MHSSVSHSVRQSAQCPHSKIVERASRSFVLPNNLRPRLKVARSALLIWFARRGLRSSCMLPSELHLVYSPRRADRSAHLLLLNAFFVSSSRRVASRIVSSPLVSSRPSRLSRYLCWRLGSPLVGWKIDNLAFDISRFVSRSMILVQHAKLFCFFFILGVLELRCGVELAVISKSVVKFHLKFFFQV